MSIFSGIGNFFGGVGHDIETGASDAEHFVSGLFSAPKGQPKAPAKPNIIQRAGSAISGAAKAAEAQAAHDAQLASQVVVPTVHAIAAPVVAAARPIVRTINNVPIAVEHGASALGNDAVNAAKSVGNTKLQGIDQLTGKNGHTVGGVINSTVNKPIIQPALNLGKDLGTLAYADATNTAPVRKVSLRNVTANDLQTAVNAATLGKGTAAKEESANLLSKIFGGAKAGGTIGTTQGVSDAVRNKTPIKQAIINTGADALGGAVLGAGGSALEHAVHPALGAVTDDIKAGSPILKSQVGAVSKDVPKSELGAQILNHYKPTPTPTAGEQQALQHVLNNPEQVMKTYNARVTKEFGSSNVVSGDEAKFSIPGFDATKSSSYHEPASAIAKVKYDQLLSDPTTQDKPVLIMSGGSGAGKTKALREQLGSSIKDYAAIVDTNSNKLGSAQGKIEQALGSGRPVQVFHVHRDAVDAFENGVIPRAAKIGRIVPVQAHLDTHLGSREVVNELASRYANNPAVDFSGIDNTKGLNKSVTTSLDQLPEVGYNRDELATKIGGILHDQHAQGNISPEELQTYLGSSAPAEQGAIRAEQEPVQSAPQATNPKVKPNRFTEHVQESPEVSQEVQDAVSGVHTQRSTQGLIDRADQDIQSKGLDKATQDIHDALSKPDGQITDQDIANGIRTAIANDGAGNHDAATSIYDSLSDHLVDAGRRVQAGSILANRTPEGQKFMAIKGLKKAGVALTDDMKQELDGIVAKMKSAPEGSQERSEAMQDMSKFISKSVPASKGDKIFNLWRTGLLTGPQTITKVVASHGVMSLLEKAKDVPAVALDKVLSKVTGQRSTALTLRGLKTGGGTGLKAGAHLLRTGYDTEGTGGLSDTAAGMVGHSEVNYGDGKIGKLLNLYTQKTGQTHAALPKLFYSSAKANDLAKQAVAAAKTQGVAQNELDNFVSNYLANPPKEVLEEANTAAKQATFQQTNNLTKLAGQLKKAGGMRWLAPFAHIASAILSDAADYSPIGAGKAIYQAVKDKGEAGWTPQVQKHFVEELGRSITGTSALALGGALYEAGLMTTGYPTDDPKEAALWKAEGKQENSIKIGGKWRQTSILGPLGTVLASGGYFQSAQNQGKGNGLESAAFGMLNNITGQSYLSGLTDAANAVTTPKEFANSEVKSLAGSIIPTALGTVARAVDPLQRTATGPLQAIESKIPGLRDTLPTSTDAFGNTMQRQGGVLTNLLDPTRPTNASTDPVIGELERLNGTGNTVIPSPSAQKTLTAGGVKTKLTPQQQNQNLATSGPQILSTFKQLMNTPAYAKLSDSNKATALNNAMKDIEAVTHVQVLSGINPGAAQKAIMGLTTNQKGMLAGQPSSTDYMALNSGGKSTSASDPKAKYADNVAALKQGVAAGTIDAEQAYTKQLALNKEAVTSNYSTEVSQLFAMSKTSLDAFVAANPAKAPLLSQVKALDNSLTAAGVQSKDKFSNISSTGGKITISLTGAKKIKVAKVKMPKLTIPKIKLVKPKLPSTKVTHLKLAKVPKFKTTTQKAKIVV